MSIHAKTNKLKIYKRSENALWVIGILVGLVLSFIGSANLLKIYSFFVVVILIGSTLFVMSRKCPNCGEYFHGSSPFWGNTLRQSCAHCGIKINGNCA